MQFYKYSNAINTTLKFRNCADLAGTREHEKRARSVLERLPQAQVMGKLSHTAWCGITKGGIQEGSGSIREIVPLLYSFRDEPCKRIVRSKTPKRVFGGLGSIFTPGETKKYTEKSWA